MPGFSSAVPRVEGGGTGVVVVVGVAGYPDIPQPHSVMSYLDVSYLQAKASGNRLPADAEPGAIHISSLTSGRLLASVATRQPAITGSQGDSSDGSPNKQLTKALTGGSGTAAGTVEQLSGIM